jgi:hypothetical protein
MSSDRAGTGLLTLARHFAAAERAGHGVPATTALDPKTALRDSQAAIGRVMSRHQLLDRRAGRSAWADFSRQAAAGELHLHRLLSGLPDHDARAVEAVTNWTACLRRRPVQRRQHRFQPALRLSDRDACLRGAACVSTTPNWEFLSPPPASGRRADARLRLQLRRNAGRLRPHADGRPCSTRGDGSRRPGLWRTPDPPTSWANRCAN